MIRKFDLLVALYIFGVMVTELMGAKTFPLLHVSWAHLNASVAIFVLPLLFTATDVVVEVYGRARARSLVFSGILMVFLVMLFALLATHLPASPRFASREAAYDTIFGASIRIAAASLTAFAVSELLDVAIFSKLRQKMHNKALWLRNNVSNFVSMGVDSVVFITLAFYAFGHPFGSNVSFLTSLIIPYWLIKCAFSVFETPLVYAGVRWLKGTKKSTAKVAPEAA
ncbi:MAG TPA: queuosine precursor transporter [Patescibacteria group bacterium]|nr:queuosine precursor transporter [Patescibacteria group bacterium]